MHPHRACTAVQMCRSGTHRQGTLPPRDTRASQRCRWRFASTCCQGHAGVGSRVATAGRGGSAPRCEWQRSQRLTAARIAIGARNRADDAGGPAFCHVGVVVAGRTVAGGGGHGSLGRCGVVWARRARAHRDHVDLVVVGPFRARDGDAGGAPAHVRWRLQGAAVQRGACGAWHQ